MPLKIERRTLNDASHTFDVNANLSESGNKIDIPMDRWIKTIYLVLKAQWDSSAASVLNEDNPMSLLKNVALVVNGKSVRDVDFALLHYKNVFDHYGRVPSRQRSVAGGALNDQQLIAVAKFDFCTEPSFPNAHQNALDALLPAHELSSLHVRVDTGAVADLGTNETLDSATLYPILEEVTMDDGTERALFGSNREKLLFIQESMSEKTIGGAAQNYQFEIDLPTGNILRRSLIKAVDNGVRDDAIVTDFRTVVKTLGIEDQWGWEAAQIDDRIGLGIGNKTDLGELEASTSAGIVHTYKGIVNNDYRDLGYLNLRGARSGTAKWQANVGSPTPVSKVVMLHEELLAGSEALGRIA